MSRKEGAREGTGPKHTKVALGLTDLKQGLEDFGHAPMQKGDATSVFRHVGENGPADLGHAPAQKGGATSAFTHMGGMEPADHALAPAQIGGATSAVRCASVVPLAGMVPRQHFA